MIDPLLAIPAPIGGSSRFAIGLVLYSLGKRKKPFFGDYRNWGVVKTAGAQA